MKVHTVLIDAHNCFFLRNFDGAERAIRSLPGATTAESLVVHANLYFIAMARGDIDAATRLYDSVIQADPLGFRKLGLSSLLYHDPDSQQYPLTLEETELLLKAAGTPGEARPGDDRSRV